MNNMMFGKSNPRHVLRRVILEKAGYSARLKSPGFLVKRSHGISDMKRFDRTPINQCPGRKTFINYPKRDLRGPLFEPPGAYKRIDRGDAAPRARHVKALPEALDVLFRDQALCLVAGDNVVPNARPPEHEGHLFHQLVPMRDGDDKAVMIINHAGQDSRLARPGRKFGNYDMVIERPLQFDLADYFFLVRPQTHT